MEDLVIYGSSSLAQGQREVESNLLTGLKELIKLLSLTHIELCRNTFKIFGL